MTKWFHSHISEAALMLYALQKLPCKIVVKTEPIFDALNDQIVLITVYSHFRRWHKLGVWEQVAHVFALLDRQQAGRGQTKQVVVDSQRVPTTQKGGAQGTFLNSL